MRLAATIAVLLLAGLVNLALWYLPNRPVPLEPPPGGRLKSVSFAPFRDGQSPLTRTYPTREQIDADLAALAPQVAGIRTYTSREGLEVVPELARKHGLTVTMGAWLSKELDRNELEVAALIDLANRYPDTISRVIVGNEVLLRRELTPAALGAYIDRVKAAVKQPVSYADVWEWWIKYPEMADHVDFLTIHLLPYWEDVPAAVDTAPERIRSSYRAIAERFPGKPILVGETGWPTAGRSRGAASTGLVDKARFVNGFVRLAQEEGFDYNLIEAFDQNWKQRLEGTVGGHWGLYGTDRVAKFSLAGPVVANPGWPALWLASTLIACGLLAATARSAAPLPTGRFALLALLATGLASAFVHAADRAWHWNYYWDDVALGLLLLALEALLAVALLVATRQVLQSDRLEREALRPTALRLPAGPPTLGDAGSLVVTALGIIAAAWSVLIVVDGRYRDFPNPDMLIMAFGLPVLGLLRAARRPAGMPAAAAFAAGSLLRPALAAPPAAAPSLGAAARAVPLDAVLAGLLLGGAVATVLAEGAVPMESVLNGQLPFRAAMAEVDWARPNVEALSWAALQVLLAVPFAASVLAARAPRRLREPLPAAAGAAD